MPFKKHSPGCVCCAKAVFTEPSGNNRFWRYTGNTNWLQISPSTILGTPSEVIGIDIERKYVLIRKNSDSTTWMYHPYTGVVIGQLWNGSCDIASTTSTSIDYIHSKNIGFGTINGGLGTIDNNGDFINGPYLNIQAGTRYTVVDNGDLWSTVALPPNDFKLYLNSGIAGTASGGGTPTADVVGLAGEREITCLFSDGTDLYINHYLNTTTFQDNMVSNLETDGTNTELIATLDLYGTDRTIVHAHWNGLENRFEGASRPALTPSPIRHDWFELTSGKFMEMFPYTILSPGNNWQPASQSFAFGGPVLEEAWDDL